MRKNPETIRSPDQQDQPGTLDCPFEGSRGTWFWIWAIGLGVFFVTLLGGIIFAPTIFRRSETPLLESECLVLLPMPSSEDLQSHLFGGLNLQRTFSDLEVFRSWLRQNGVLVPPEVVIHLAAFDLGKSSSSERPPSLQKGPGGFSVRLSYQAQDPAQACLAVEKAGQEIARLWQTQWEQHQAGLRRQFQETAHQIQSAWIGGALQEELFLEYVDQWSTLLTVGPFTEESPFPSGSASLRPAESQIPESESAGLPEPEANRPSPMQENPQWIALSQTLQQWQTRRQKLLEDRTPIHPEVQQAEVWIAQTEALLAKTPRWLTPSEASFPNTSPQHSPNSAQSLPRFSSAPSGSSWDSSRRAPPQAPRPTVSSEAAADPIKSSPGGSTASEANRTYQREFADRLEEFRSFWEVFVARQMQGQQIVQQRIRQAQELLRRLDGAGQAGLVCLQSSVRPMGEMASVGSETRLWKLGGVSLMAALAAAALSRVALRRFPPRVQAPSPISTPSNAAETQPPGSEQRNQTEGIVSKASSSEPPRFPASPPALSAGGLLRSESVLPAPPAPGPADSSPKADPDPELETLKDCIMTLEELQTGLSVPVIGAPVHVPRSPDASLPANRKKSDGDESRPGKESPLA